MWVRETEGTGNVSSHHLHVVHIVRPYSFEQMLSQTAYASYLLDWLCQSTSRPAGLYNDWKRDESRQWIVPWEERKSGVLHWFLLQWHTLQTHSSSTTWIVSGFTRRFQPKTSGVLFRVFPVNTVLYSAEMLFLWLNCRLLLTGMPLFYILSDLCFYMASPDLSNLVFSSGMKLVQVGNTIWVLRDEFCRIPISTLTLTGTYIHLSMTVFVFFHISHLWLLGSGS